MKILSSSRTRTRIGLSGILAWTGLALTALAPVAAQAQSYTLTDLGTLGGTYTYSQGNGVNASGQVAGYAGTASNDTHAFLSGVNGGALKDLGTLPGASTSTGFGVNASGQVTGYSTMAGGSNTHAFLSGPNGGALQDLGTLPGGGYSLGFGVNVSGQVTGVADPGNGNFGHAFLSGPNGIGLTDLGTLGGGFSQGNGVNDGGQVAGDSSTAGGAVHAFFFSQGAMTDLGTLGGTNSSDAGVNASGQVSGDSDTAGGTVRAFLSGQHGGTLQDLGTLGGTYSFGRGVNAQGQVVGGSSTARGAQDAYIFSNGVMTDLNRLIAPGSGFMLTQATGISDTGFITGYGVNRNGQEDAFLLTPNANPVPEASSVISLALMLALGLAELAVARRKRMA